MAAVTAGTLCTALSTKGGNVKDMYGLVARLIASAGLLLLAAALAVT
ncbi:MAG: hypothetical protein ACK2UC_00300 [Anaerolineae bacterium]